MLVAIPRERFAFYQDQPWSVLVKAVEDGALSTARDVDRSLWEALPPEVKGDKYVFHHPRLVGYALMREADRYEQTILGKEDVALLWYQGW